MGLYNLSRYRQRIGLDALLGLILSATTRTGKARAFKARTGYGVLCNTSLNFNGRGFINNIRDLDAYTHEHGLDGFVVDGRVYMRKASENYQAVVQRSGEPASRVPS